MRSFVRQTEYTAEEWKEMMAELVADRRAVSQFDPTREASVAGEETGVMCTFRSPCLPQRSVSLLNIAPLPCGRIVR